MANMRVKPPLLRKRHVAPARAAALRYGVAVLSIILAIIPAFLLSDLVESRLVVFSVAIMVSAWYGGWKPGLVATSFALTVSSYFSFAGAQSPRRLSQSHHTSHAICICCAAYLLVQCGIALCAGRPAALGVQFPFPGDECSIWHLPLQRRGDHSGR